MTLQVYWEFVTDLGDSAVTLPLAALTLIFLLLSRWPRAALILGLAVCGCAIAVGILKLALETCGHSLIGASLTSPSAHMAISTIVYGSLAVLFGCSLSPRHRWALSAGATLLIGAIGISRVALGTHTPAEVLVGFTVGLAGVAIFHRRLLAGPLVTLRVRRLALAGLILVAVMHGSRWQIEEFLRSIVTLIRTHVPRCP